MLCPFLPAPSLRGRLASLRTFSERVVGRIHKILISLVISPIVRPSFGVESIFLPAVREAPLSAAVSAAAVYPDRDRSAQGAPR